MRTPGLPLCLEVEKAWQAGITVVVAAGNGGRDNSAGTLGYYIRAGTHSMTRGYLLGRKNFRQVMECGDGA